MPFSAKEYQGSFNQQELALLQEAYNRACQLLQRCPTTHEAKEQLAKLVIRVFEDSDHDPLVTSNRVYEITNLFEDTGKPK